MFKIQYTFKQDIDPPGTSGIWALSSIAHPQILQRWQLGSRKLKIGRKKKNIFLTFFSD